MLSTSGVYQRGRINELMKEAAMLWEGAVAFQAQAKQQHARGETIPAQASMVGPLTVEA